MQTEPYRYADEAVSPAFLPAGMPAIQSVRSRIRLGGPAVIQVLVADIGLDGSGHAIAQRTSRRGACAELGWLCRSAGHRRFRCAPQLSRVVCESPPVSEPDSPASAPREGRPFPAGGQVRASPAGRRGYPNREASRTRRRDDGGSFRDGIDRVAVARSFVFDFLDTKDGIAGDGQLKHFNALVETCETLVALVRRPRRGQEPHLVEPTLFTALLGEHEMSEMDRIECAPENADSHGCSPAAGPLAPLRSG